MIAIEPHLPILQVVVPLFGALITAFLRKGTLAWAVTLAVSWITPVIAAALLYKVMVTGETLSYVIGGWSVPQGIEYRVDILSASILMLVSVVGAVIMPYARKSVAKEIDSHQQAWFYTMYLLCLAGLLGITITGDAFNAFVFLEISSLATYTMIALGRHRRALIAAYQYLILGTIGATLYVIGVALLYIVTGTLNFVDIASKLTELQGDQLRPVYTALAFLVVGVSLKLALFPLHVWLPNAYAYAPSMATAFLAGTATKVAVYLLLRVLFMIFGVKLAFESMTTSELLLLLSLMAMFSASFAACFEKNYKRMLAYSSVAQVGYITLGIGLWNASGLTGATVHIFNHAIIKTALFLSLGAVFYRLGTLRVEAMSGIGRRMPLTMGVFAIAGLGLIGVPGTAGFISKWYLALGAIDREWWLLVFLIVLSSLLAVVYVGRIIEVAYFREPGPDVAELNEVPISMLVPTVVLGLATVYFGFDTRVTAGVAQDIAAFLLQGFTPDQLQGAK